jgi:carbonic anhydrase/acetyltransferase-like protein (isoleucine patch superfamily)
MAIIKSVRGFTPKMGKNCYLAEIGNDVTIGHNVVIHGARIEDKVLIGIGSVVLENSVLEPNSLYAGVPVRRIKTVDPKRRESMIKRIAKDYIMYSDWYKEEDQ